MAFISHYISSNLSVHVCMHLLVMITNDNLHVLEAHDSGKLTHAITKNSENQCSE